MGLWFGFLNVDEELFLDALKIVIAIIIALVIFIIIFKVIKRTLLKKATTKKQITNVNFFLNMIKYFFIILFFIIIVSTYFGTWIQFGLAAGLLTAALGWALQKPITGIAAWIMIALRRPFQIGDRVIISNLTGDIQDITLTHIHLEEVGGTIEGEEKSGRTIMIPNSILFEKEIINYTAQHEYILDEITAAITYESNLEEAENIMMNAVTNIMKPYHESFPKKIPIVPHTRLLFKDSGIDVTVRYNTIVRMRNQIATNIRRAIFSKIRTSKDVEIAYPHTEVLFREKASP